MEISYTYSLISKENYGEYPTKTSGTAWEQLKNGEGFLTHLKIENEDPFVSYSTQRVVTFSVKRVYLAYVDTEIAQEVVQPVWVFEGKASIYGGRTADWTTYVPAIDREETRRLLSQNISTTTSTPSPQIE